MGPPEANAYEGQSAGNIEMLNKLLDKFVPQCTQLKKDEMSAKHAYDMLLKAQIAQASSDRDEKAEFKAETMQVQTAQIPLSMTSFKDYSKNKQAGGVQGMIQTIIDDAKAMEIEAIVEYEQECGAITQQL